MVWTFLRPCRSQKCNLWPYLLLSRSAGTIPFSNCGGKRPFGTDHIVARQVPPEIVMLVLVAPVDLVAADDVEAVAVHDENAGRARGAVLAAAPERRDINAVRPAMDGVRPRIAGLGEDLFGLDDLVNLRRRRAALHVHHIDPRRPDAGNDEIAALPERMAVHRRQRGGTGVPAEMMKLVADIGHEQCVDDLAIARRGRIHIDHRQPVRLGGVRAQHQRIGQRLRRGFDGERGRGVEGGVGSDGHLKLLP